MDTYSIRMDNFGRRDPAHLLSDQVTGGRYFFLNLAAKSRAVLTLAMGGRERCNPDYRILRTTFPFYVMEYVESGSGTVQLDSTTHSIGPGVVFAYAPRTRYEIQTDPDDTMVKYFVAFTGRDARQRLRRCGLEIGAARQLAAHAEVTSVWEDLVREGQRSGDVAGRICAALFELLLLKVEDTATFVARNREPAREAFLRCKALIDAKAESLESLAQIAVAASVEASSVCRWFRRYQGTSPYQYLMRRKMNLAAEYLIENGGMVKEAAERTGFADPFHFSRAFKAVHGVAPSDLLRYRFAAKS
jgi:AraC family transcriptional regulator